MSASTLFEEQFVHLDDHGATPTKDQIALVSGADVPILELDLPSGLQGQAREQVARRQLLDRIGLDQQDIEMRPFETEQSDRWSRVFVTDSAKLVDWRKGRAIKTRAVLPDFLALTTAPDLWTVGRHGTSCVVRLGPYDGFSAPSPVAMMMLSRRLRSDIARPKAILFVGDLDPSLNLIADEFDVPVVKAVDDLAALNIEKPSILGHGEIAMNLLRNPQLARARLQRRVLLWRWPALFGLIAAGLWGASEVIQTNRIEGQSRAVQIETLALVKTHFVPNGPILDVRSQVGRELTALRSAMGSDAPQLAMLDLFAQASSVLMSSGAAIETVISLNADTVTLVLRVDNFAAADSIAKDLTEAGLNAEIMESLVSEAAEGVRTEILLSGPQRGVQQ
ncbi:MAG: general secretion pathway protein L [Candidatus Azotimanducaceae bacterium]